jgi:predicted MPP superfamily phosphohydrolase
VKILHLSDLHLRDGWYEEQGAILDSFSKDVKHLFLDEPPPLLIFSGDFVRAGRDAHFFKLFEQYFDPVLTGIGIDRTRRVFVPGNHDISRDVIKFSTLNALARDDDDETRFNDLIYTEYKDVVYPKFRSYLDFEARFSGHGCGESSFCGAGHDVGDGIGIYTLNTALFSFGGMIGPDGHAMDDEGLLRIETRRLNKWLQETSHGYRILVMHHPSNHLIGWAKTQIEQLIQRSFDLVLQGHIHKSDAAYVDTGISLTTICTAPPLFTRKGEILGYAVIDVDASTRSVKLSYRQASRSLKFVAGSFFTGTDDGTLRFGLEAGVDRNVPHVRPSQYSADATLDLLRTRFESATTCHSSLGPLWVAPDIGTLPETHDEKDRGPVTAARDLLSDSDDLIIKAPPQFGLTSLGHFLAFEARGRSDPVFSISSSRPRSFPIMKPVCGKRSTRTSKSLGPRQPPLSG